MTTTPTTDDASPRTIQTMSPANRDAAWAYLRRRASQGVRAKSLLNMAYALDFLDRGLAGKPFADATEEDFEGFMEDLRAGRLNKRTVKTLSLHTVAGVLRCLLAYYRWASPTKTLPPAVDATLRLARQPAPVPRIPISDQEYAALCAAARTPRDRAFMATLRDSGMRISELVSLRIRDVAFKDNGVAWLRIPRDAPNLKTGPRDVVVYRCVADLRAWLDYHPHRLAGDWPVFCPIRPRRPGPRSLHTKHANTLLARLSEKAGVRRVCPQLFRHTRVTETARYNWSEAKMCIQFGWVPTSRMPRPYTHLRPEDLERQVLMDAGVPVADEAASRPRIPTPAEALATALNVFLAEAVRQAQA